MPATFTRPSVETERKDTGYRRQAAARPPAHRRRRRDENWDSRQPRRRGPRELLIRYRMAVLSPSPATSCSSLSWSAPSSSARASGHIDGADNVHLRLASLWRSRRSSGSTPPSCCSPPSPWKSPAASSSAKSTSWKSGSASARPAVRRAAPWLVATIDPRLCSSSPDNGSPGNSSPRRASSISSNPNSHFFYLVTGTHGVHLAARTRRPRLRAGRHVPLPSASKCARSPSTAPPGTGTPWAPSGSSSSACSPSRNEIETRCRILLRSCFHHSFSRAILGQSPRLRPLPRRHRRQHSANPQGTPPRNSPPRNPRRRHLRRSFT